VSWMDLGKVDPGPGGGPEEQVVQQASYQLPAWAKTVGMAAVAGAAVGMIVVPVLMSQGMFVKTSMSKKKLAWRSSAIGAAVAVPLLAAYA